MKRKFARRALSGLLSLLMVVGLLPFTAMAAERGPKVNNVDIQYVSSDEEEKDLSFLKDIVPVPIDKETDLNWPHLYDGNSQYGDFYRIPAPEKTFYYDFDADTLYVLDRLEWDYLDADGNTTRLTSDKPSDIIGNHGDYSPITKNIIYGKTDTVKIVYYWYIVSKESKPDLLNYITGLNRTVYSNHEALEASPENVYTVESRENLSVAYSTSMDMKNLTFASTGEDAWTSMYNYGLSFISDNSLINLIFTFDDAIDVANSDFSQAVLTSDMFVMDPADIIKNGQTVVMPCYWNGEKALAAKHAGTLQTLITLDNVQLSIKNEGWVYDSAAGGYKLDVHNYGEVKGVSIINSWMMSSGTIDGGSKTDDFTIISTEKVSVPGMNKTIVLEDGTEVDADTAAAGDEVKFKLNSTVPENLKEIIKYEVGEEGDEFADGTADGEYTLTFHDQMDDAFVNPANYVVKIGDRQLTAEQYAIRTNDLTDGCDFEIDLDLAALYNDDVITDADLGITPITVTYTATLDEDTTAGEYHNIAWVTFLDSKSAKDTVTVETFKIKIFKYDQADNTGLAGAEFTLTDSEGAVIATVTSGEDGYAVIDGLDAGTYILTETEAPDGYVKSDTPLTIVIPDNADGDNVVSVSFANSQIPHTGGTGTLMFTIGGAAIIATAGVLLLVSRKKKKA